jgi:cation diffusion facilitator CzcD-associated flavoprotein CzcO
MTSDKRNFIIVGGGLAGAKAAEALRDNGFDGKIVLYAAEGRRPYDVRRCRRSTSRARRHYPTSPSTRPTGTANTTSVSG